MKIRNPKVSAEMYATDATKTLADELKAKGWREFGICCYKKGDWAVDLDTSSWMILSIKSNPRVFDVHVPAGTYEARWTANLIEHLCSLEEERHRLRAVLESIRDNPREASQTATSALKQCCHQWLVNMAIPEKQMGRVYCVICGAIAAQT